MVRVSFIAVKENKTLQLPGSTSTNRSISDMPHPPNVGFEITDLETGIKYRVVSVKDVRQGSTVPGFLDYMAELERV